MYRDAYQRGLFSIFFSGGSKPLEIWETLTKDGYIKRFIDPEIKTMVLEVRGTNVSTTYMKCPKGSQVLGISMPFLIMIVKNLKKYFTFEVTILDDTRTRRRFRVSNFQSTTQILPMCTVMPISLADGWNQIQFNLSEFTRKAYKRQFVEVQNVKINANIRIRRIYFAERLIPEEDLPAEYKLFLPMSTKEKKKIPEKAAKPEKPEKPARMNKMELAAVAPEEVVAVTEADAGEPVETEHKAPSVEKLGSTVKVSSAAKVTSLEKVASAARVASGEAMEGAEGTEGAEKAPSVEKVPSGQKAPSAEKVASAERVPSGGNPPAEGAPETVPDGEVTEPVQTEEPAAVEAPSPTD